MAVTSGLSDFPDARDSAVLQRPRSAWALSWPLALGLVLFVWLPNSKGCRCWPTPTATGTSPSATGSWRTARCRRSTATPSPSPASPGSPRSGCRRSCWRSPTTSAAGAAWRRSAAAAIGFTFALMMRLLLRDIRPLPALLFTVAAARHDGAASSGAPARARLPAHADLGGGPGARRRGTPRAASRSLLLAMLAWANLHGGFTLGLLLCGAFALEAVVGARDAAERKLAVHRMGEVRHRRRCWSPASRPMARNRSWSPSRIFNLGDALGMISEWQSPDFQQHAAAGS